MKKSKTFYFLSPISLKSTSIEKDKNEQHLIGTQATCFLFLFFLFFSILEESNIFKWY